MLVPVSIVFLGGPTKIWLFLGHRHQLSPSSDSKSEQASELPSELQSGDGRKLTSPIFFGEDFLFLNPN